MKKETETDTNMGQRLRQRGEDSEKQTETKRTEAEIGKDRQKETEPETKVGPATVDLRMSNPDILQHKLDKQLALLSENRTQNKLCSDSDAVL